MLRLVSADARNSWGWRYSVRLLHIGLLLKKFDWRCSMKKVDFEKFIGEMVEIQLFNDKTICGCLRKTQDEMFKNDANLYLPKNYYFVTESLNSKMSISCLFRSSHVKRMIRI